MFTLPAAADERSLESIKKIIDASNAKYIECFKNRDTRTFGSLFTDDAILMEPGRPAIQGRADIEQWLLNDTQNAALKEGTITTLDLYQIDDMIYETGSFRFVFQAQGKEPNVAKGKYLDIWKALPDGSWKIYREVNIASE